MYKILNELIYMVQVTGLISYHNAEISFLLEGYQWGQQVAPKFGLTYFMALFRYCVIFLHHINQTGRLV